jgi:hypothetical protein
MSKISKIFGGGKDKSAQRAAEEARQREAQRQARLAQGRGNIDSAFSSFDDPYYEGRAKAYSDFAMPQLEEQFGAQKKKLIYALSRGGLLNSSSAAQKNRDLQGEYDRNRQLITSRGGQYGTDARRDVANSRAQLLSILSSTEDPTTVANEAVRQAATLRAQPSFDPLGSLFTDIAGTIDKNTRAATIGTSFGGVGLSQDGNGQRSGRIVR